MVDASEEAYPGRTHRVVVWEKELEAEDATYKNYISTVFSEPEISYSLTFIAASAWSIDQYVEVSSVLLMWYRRDAWYWLILQPLRLFDDPLRQWRRHCEGLPLLWRQTEA